MLSLSPFDPWETPDSSRPPDYHQSLTLVDNEATVFLTLRGICQDVLKRPAEEFGLLKPILPAKASSAILGHGKQGLQGGGILQNTGAHLEEVRGRPD